MCPKERMTPLLFNCTPFLFSPFLPFSLLFLPFSLLLSLLPPLRPPICFASLYVSVSGVIYFFFFSQLNRPNGKELEAVLAQAYEGDQPKSGDVVTFAVTHFSKSKRPKQPRIFRIRKDLSWRDVQDNALAYIPRKVSWNGTFSSSLFLFLLFYSLPSCFYLYSFFFLFLFHLLSRALPVCPFFTIRFAFFP